MASNIVAAALQWNDFLIADLCKIIGEYVRPIDADRVRWMFVTSEAEKIEVSCPNDIFPDEDESLTISYADQSSAWSKMSIRDRYYSMNARTFTVELKLPYLPYFPIRRTTYKLRALLKHMTMKVNRGAQSSVFKWKYVFCSYTSTLGQLLRETWNPEAWWDNFGEQMNSIPEPILAPPTPRCKYTDDAYFAQMRENIARFTKRD